MPELVNHYVISHNTIVLNSLGFHADVFFNYSVNNLAKRNQSAARVI